MHKLYQCLPKQLTKSTIYRIIYAIIDMEEKHMYNLCELHIIRHYSNIRTTGNS